MHGSLLYHPLVNRLARTALRPLSPLLPEAWKFPVHGLIRVRLGQGAHVYLYGHPSNYVTKRLFWGGADAFEPHVMRVLRPLFARVNLFVDAGANVGYYALAATALAPHLRVIAFEPHPAVYRHLSANVARNRAARVTPEPLALSDAEGEVDFYVPVSRKYAGLPEQLPSTSSFDPRQAAQRDAVERITVTSTTLDAYKARSGLPRIDLLKIDVEGAEALVLAGADGVLREDRPVICCEVLSSRTHDALCERLSEHAYHAYQMTREGIQRVRSLAHDASVSSDFLLIPAERSDEVLGVVSSAP